MFDVGDEHAIALAGFAGFDVEQELGHEVQRQALGAGTGALRASQHQVEDVLEQVAGVTRGNEPLDAVDVPGPVGLLDSFGSGSAHIGAGIRLGEHHGRSPAAFGG
ncbi:Uncharacterised protein [Mycobacterium tuberculosis]|uniref:Uncharacterized protein n=1 Tax=Mycobacterium tuberculosis TaxID=1773 RepID=A0A654ZY62_MYCTX|nr:Uncharacterised protein [Mycobacterium tuberculosis]CKR51294.1 Uncharacterised protein [Mycobacterium tuberculosis]CNN23692.1 Uncharacterised protein [Mycobacterium tuberculosis]CNU28048.1 Uncharacterised protein [Mycobacterium tuberculosis]CNV21136.1 Uncharacterised protein [Mycobacterium tuberculosis]